MNHPSDLNRVQAIAFLSLLNCPVSMPCLREVLGEGGARDALSLADELHCLTKTEDGFLFTMRTEEALRQELTPAHLINPLSRLRALCAPTANRWKSLLDGLFARMDLPAAERAALLNHMGEEALDRYDFPAAAEFFSVALAQACTLPISARKTPFIRTVLNLSRMDLILGQCSPETLELQREALTMVNEGNLTAEDAMLMLYAGMGEHMCGSFLQGYRLRERGMEALSYFHDPRLEAEARPIISWQYSQLGDFPRATAYHESMVLSLENHPLDIDIVSFMYPPLVISYVYTGEYYRALSISKLIYNRAREMGNTPAAILMLSLIGRTYIYLDDLENASNFLWRAYAQALQENYGWGLYYTLFAIAFLQFRMGNPAACHENLVSAIRLARERRYRPILSSPFMLEILKFLKDRGFPPIEGFEYETVLQESLTAPNIHMAGAAHRFVAIQGCEKGERTEAILRELNQSIQLLERSGDKRELGKTYLELALFCQSRGDDAGAASAAQNAWDCLTEQDRKAFPHDLISLIRRTEDPVSLSVLLEVDWLELRSFIDPSQMIARLITIFCRQLEAENGAFLVVRDGQPSLYQTQNITRDRKAPQHQRMLGLASKVIGDKSLLTLQSGEDSRSRPDLDFDAPPRFVVCLPFPDRGGVGAVLYLESHYNTAQLTDEDRSLLASFANKMAPALFAALENTRPNSPAEELRASSVGEISPSANPGEGEKSYCPSIDGTMLALEALADRVAPTRVPVLVTGETGTGKEVLCTRIFEGSDYRQAFVRVNCGAIPESLMESELFGFERGSFTGATHQRKGYFEQAHGGTLLLDEIGELSPAMQVKLLRVLQESEILRIGGTSPIKVDFRLIAATNKDLQKEVDAGRFRKDLFYRLNIVELPIPPLRERRSDVINLANHFARTFCRELGRPLCAFSPEAAAELLDYHWPGNIRELENVVRKTVLFTDGPLISRLALSRSAPAATPEPSAPILPLEEMERRYILRVLRTCGGRVGGPGGAAERLGLKRTTLNSKIKKLGIHYTDGEG